MIIKSARLQCLSSFVIKIVALLTMTLDHVGAFIEYYYPQVEGPLAITVLVLRAIGRLAFPLFLFLLAEGMRHTHDRGNYLLRFAILFAVILIIQAGLGQIPQLSVLTQLSQPFADLLCLAAFAYLYERGDKWRWLIALPLAYEVLSFVAVLMANNGNPFLPNYLLCQYNLLGVAVFLPMYFAPRIVRKTLLNTGLGVDATPESEGTIVKTGGDSRLLLTNLETYDERQFQAHVNALSAAFAAIALIVFWGIAYLTEGTGFYFECLSGTSLSFETYGVLGAFIILLYNGRLGYKGKWWNYFQYSYFPVHIALLALIFYLISL